MEAGAHYGHICEKWSTNWKNHFVPNYHTIIHIKNKVYYHTISSHRYSDGKEKSLKKALNLYTFIKILQFLDNFQKNLVKVRTRTRENKKNGEKVFIIIIICSIWALEKCAIKHQFE